MYKFSNKAIELIQCKYIYIYTHTHTHTHIFSNNIGLIGYSYTKKNKEPQSLLPTIHKNSWKISQRTGCEI